MLYENYLGKTDATFTLNFSTGSAMVLAQYYKVVRSGQCGYCYIMETMMANTRALAKRIADLTAPGPPSRHPDRVRRGLAHSARLRRRQ